MSGNIDFTVPAIISKGLAASFEATTGGFTAPSVAVFTYTWSAPEFSPDTHIGATYTPIVPAIPGTYSMTLTVSSEGYCNLMKTKDVEVLSCSMPGSTVNFTAFAPCSNATIGDYWQLTDARESNNVQTYKVKLMADGRIWMVQDLKFGDQCDKTTFSGSNGSDQIGNVTLLNDKIYYGDCRNHPQSGFGVGYLYDWAAAVSHIDAYVGGSYTGCRGIDAGTTGTAPGACQGICPSNWHLPTSDEVASAIVPFALAYATTSCHGWCPGEEWDPSDNAPRTNPDGSWDTTWRSVYWTSTGSINNACGIYVTSGPPTPSFSDRKAFSALVRCIRNY
jgi:uncharacterized protein (TIGR02145 family)